MAEAAYRVRWTEDGVEQVVTATADDAAGTVTLKLADGQELVVPTNTGRALSILLTHLVYPVLDPRHTDLVTEYFSRGVWRNLSGS
jgi:hypothetical protein